MQNLLLLGVAAYLLTRQSTTTSGGGGGGGNQGGGNGNRNGGGGNGGGGNGGGGGGNGGGGTLAPLVALILPHVNVGGKDMVVTDLPLPAGSFNKAVVCNRPGGEMRVADIQIKYDRYLKEFIRYRNLTLIQKGFPYNIYILNLRKKAYQNAIEFHLSQCK